MNSEQLHKGTNYLLTKEAGWLGRYLSMKMNKSQPQFDKPWTNTAIATPNAILNEALPGSGLITGIPTEMAMNRANLGGTTKDRRANMDKTHNELKQRSLGGNAAHGAKALMGPMALLGALSGAGVGAFIGHNKQDDHWNALSGGLAGLGAGALGGGAIGGIAGGIGGGVNKLIQENASDESHSRAKKMVAQHPYLTALPFGDMAGAAFG